MKGGEESRQSEDVIESVTLIPARDSTHAVS